MISPSGALVGTQQPRLLAVPPSASNAAGEDAVELAQLAGLQLDPWQQLALHHGLAEAPDGGWAAFEVKLVVSRQNGKGAILEARELAGLYLFDEDITHTAHEFATSLDAFSRLLTDIESCPDLATRVKRISRSHGEEGIELKNGHRIRFRARTNRAGRGSSNDLLVLDEDMYLPPPAINAFMPTLSARPNPQVWYMGSAPDVAEHAHAHVVANLRRRAQGGGDGSLCYLEWSPDIEHPDDLVELQRAAQAGDLAALAALEHAIAASNPGLGIRLSREHIENERRSMLPRSFAVERLSIGVYPQPEEASHVIDPSVWVAAADPTSRPTDPVVFAIDIPPDRSHASVAVAGWRPDGRAHTEIVDDRTNTGWVVNRIVELVARWDPCALVVDARSPASSLLADLAAHKLEVQTTTSSQMAQAAGGFYDAVVNDRMRHTGDVRLLEALAAARTRPLGDAWAWDRRTTTSIAPLVAATLAHWGLAVWGQSPAGATPLTGEAAPEDQSLTDDLATAGF